jgi:hypothetical protein
MARFTKGGRHLCEQLRPLFRLGFIPTAGEYEVAALAALIVIRAAKPSARRLSSPVAERGIGPPLMPAVIGARQGGAFHRPAPRRIPTLASSASTLAG